jgi:hypothetical protein
VSFLPIGRLSGDGTQLEITTGSPLGLFVGDRFEELWRHGKPLAEFLRLSVSVAHGGGEAARAYRVPFVCLDDHYFIDDAQVLAELAVHGGAPGHSCHEPSRYSPTPRRRAWAQASVAAHYERSTSDRL